MKDTNYDTKLFGRLFSAGINTIADIEGKNVCLIEEEIGDFVGLSVESIRRYKRGLVNIDKLTPKLIKWLSTNAVMRGNLSKAWLISFLDCISYEMKQNLILELFPDVINLEKSILTANNLPTPNYNKFIMRDDFDKIISGLESQSAVTLIKSIGGNGKSSLALEVAKQCISKKPEYCYLPKFTSAVWISDRNNHGTTNLNYIFDTIIETLGYTEFLKVSFEEKRYKVIQILKTQQILLIIDNFETIRDTSLAIWLINIPQPSKCIITSRRFYEEFRDNTRNIEITGLSNENSKELIVNYSKTIGLPINDITAFDSLIEKVDGNPKALEMAIGIIKYDGFTFSETLNQLLDLDGKLFADLFEWAWRLITDEEKNILEILTLFPNGTDEYSIEKILQKQNIKNLSKKLVDLSLLSRKHKSNHTEITYYLHPLVNHYASQKFKQNKEKIIIENNWLTYFIDITNKISHCHKEANTKDLKLLDKEGFKEGFEFVVGWAMLNRKYDFVIQVTDNVKYYFYIRGSWNTQYNILRAKAAKEIADYQAEFDAYVYHLNILCKQGCCLQEIEKYIAIVSELKNQHHERLTNDSLIDYQHDLALFSFMQGNYSNAINLWLENKEKVTSKRQINTTNRWLGNAYYKVNDYTKVKEHLLSFIKDLENDEYNHNSLSAYLIICKMYLKEDDTDPYERILLGLEKSEHLNDSYYIAEFQFLLAKYYLKTGNKKTSIEYCKKSVEAFKEKGCFKRTNTVELFIIEKRL